MSRSRFASLEFSLVIPLPCVCLTRLPNFIPIKTLRPLFSSRLKTLKHSVSRQKQGPVKKKHTEHHWIGDQGGHRKESHQLLQYRNPTSSTSVLASISRSLFSSTLFYTHARISNSRMHDPEKRTRCTHLSLYAPEQHTMLQYHCYMIWCIRTRDQFDIHRCQKCNHAVFCVINVYDTGTHENVRAVVK